MPSSFLLRYQDRLKDAVSRPPREGDGALRGVPGRAALAHVVTVTEVQAEGVKKDPKRRCYSAIPRS